jgi:hypothetical protein
MGTDGGSTEVVFRYWHAREGREEDLDWNLARPFFDHAIFHIDVDYSPPTPKSPSLDPLSPNPIDARTNPMLSGWFHNPTKQFVTLDLVNSAGCPVQEIIAHDLPPANCSYWIQVESLPAGTYFVRLRGERSVEIKRLIVLR